MGSKKIIRNIIIIIVVFIVVFILFLSNGLRAVSDDNSVVTFIINNGDSKNTIIKNLKEAGIIKSELSLKIYVVLNQNKDLMAGTYKFDKSENAINLLKQMQNGDYEYEKQDSIIVTFVEGKRLTNYANVIADNFDYEYNEVIDVLNNREYLESLVSKYTILTEEILDEDLYYPLEGYLYPDTYEFYSNTCIEEIIEKMIDQLAIKLSTELLAIEESNYTVHELLTMASITELEANSSEDRYTVASVIYNRLNINMSLGMDVTTYYGSKMEMGEVLTYAQLNAENAYNTRLTSFIGLPVGSICNPSFNSIMAVLYPYDTNYVYFFADIDTGNVNFFEYYKDFRLYVYGY